MSAIPIGIQLGAGQVAVIDEGDAPRVAPYLWNAAGRYVVTTFIVGGNHYALRLHRFLMDAPAGVLVDHLNGNPLDNRRCNLRTASSRENNRNRHKAHPNSRTGVRNVYHLPGSGRYVVRFDLIENGSRRFVTAGHYATLEEAARAAAEWRVRNLPEAPESTPTPEPARLLPRPVGAPKDLGPLLDYAARSRPWRTRTEG